MTRSFRFALAPLLLAALCAQPVPSVAQPARESGREPAGVPVAKPSAPRFGETVDVEVVEIEVRVTDRKGRPVPGLDRDDFKLLIDRRPVEVKYFRAVGFDGDSAGSADTPDSADSMMTSDLGSGDREPPDAAGAPPEQSLIIFLDDLHLTTPGRRQLVKALGPFLEHSVDPEIPVMVVSSAGGLKVLQELTRDRGAVLSVLADEDRSRPGGIREVVARSRSVRELREILEANSNCPIGDPCDCAVPQMLATASARGAESSGRVEATLAALETLTAALRGLPGSKTVLIASDGLDFRPGIDLYQMVADLCPTHEREVTREMLSYDLLPVYQRVTAHAAASRVTLYSLDTAGISSSGAGVDDLGTETRRARQVRDLNLQQSLFVLADETGGRAVFNSNRFDERLQGLARDVESYYSLGFTPDHAGDDQVHTIEVEVAGSHHDVRYRKAFRHLSLDGRIAERLLGTLLFGVGENPLAVGVSVDVPEAATADRTPVSIHVHLPLAGFTLSPQEDESVGVSRLVMSIQGVNGKWSPVRQERVPLRLASGEDQGSAARDVAVKTSLAPGDYLLAIGVRDEIGGVTSYLRKTFTVPARM